VIAGAPPLYGTCSTSIFDLLGERISFMPINPVEVIAHIKSGKLRALAVALYFALPRNLLQKMSSSKPGQLKRGRATKLTCTKNLQFFYCLRPEVIC
jgi:hypothetical protein